MKITNSVFTAIIEHAKKQMPYEACGFLAADCDGIINRHYEMTNTDKAADHFTMEPKEQFAAVKDMREYGYRLAAVYHSHPETPARPSEEDIRLAYDPNVSYVIISLAEPEDITVKSFKIRKVEVTAEQVDIIAG